METQEIKELESLCHSLDRELLKLSKTNEEVAVFFKSGHMRGHISKNGYNALDGFQVWSRNRDCACEFFAEDISEYSDKDKCISVKAKIVLKK